MVHSYGIYPIKIFLIYKLCLIRYYADYGIFHLFNSHTKIVHCVSRIESIKNLIYKRFNRLYQRAHSCSSLVWTIFSFSSSLLYSFVGYNWNCGTSHLTHYSEAETDIADWIRLVRQNFGINSDLEDFIHNFSTL